MNSDLIADDGDDVDDADNDSMDEAGHGKRARASILRILAVDYVARVSGLFVGFLVPLCLAGSAISSLQQAPAVAGFMRLVPRVLINTRFHLALMVGLLLTVAPYVVWRVLAIRRLVDRGTIVIGQLWEVNRAGDRGGLVYRYRVDGVDHEARQPLRFDDAVGTLEVGQDVELGVDPGRPERAVIRQLFVGS